MPEPISLVKAVTDLAGKVSPRIAVTLFIVTAVLMLLAWQAPGNFTWIDSLVQDYKTAVGLTMICSGALSFTYAATSLHAAYARRKATHNKSAEAAKRLKALHDRLGTLTLIEKHMLQEYIDCDARVVQFNATLGRCDALVDAGILRLTQLYGVKGTYMISDEAWDYLSRNRSLIATPYNPRSPRTFHSEY